MLEQKLRSPRGRTIASRVGVRQFGRGRQAVVLDTTTGGRRSRHRSSLSVVARGIGRRCRSSLAGPEDMPPRSCGSGRKTSRRPMNRFVAAGDEALRQRSRDAAAEVRLRVSSHIRAARVTPARPPLRSAGRGGQPPLCRERTVTRATNATTAPLPPTGHRHREG